MPITARPRRSALYVPGANARALDKAKNVAADVLIFDLEDSVPDARKETARESVATIVASLTGGPQEIVVRVNDLDTQWLPRDLAAMASARPDGILIPKVSRVDDVRRARAALSEAGLPRTVGLWVMIETASAVLNAAAIGAIAAVPEPSIDAFVVGTNDLVAELALPLTTGRPALLPHLSHAILAARAHGIAILDGTFNDIDDRRTLRIECRQGRDMGMDGKTLIHPTQIPVANEEFAPQEEEIVWAQRVVEAFESPDNADLEVMALAGRMVERLHERAARRTLAFAHTIAKLEAYHAERNKRPAITSRPARRPIPAPR